LIALRNFAQTCYALDSDCTPAGALSTATEPNRTKDVPMNPFVYPFVKPLARSTLAMPYVNRRLLLGAAAATLTVGFTSQAQAAPAAGTVSAMKGGAFATRSADRLALASGASVFVNDTVETEVESRLVVDLQGQTTLKLGAGARIRIDRFLAKKGGIITIESGAFLFDRPEDAPKTNFEIRSAFAVVAVRGTKFFAGPSKGVYGVFVERGVVNVSAAGQTVTVTAGEGTSILNPGDAPTEVKPWGKPRILAAYKSVQ
jgi:ferric-dicitrate binding protein FerR (iron transport regulator)